ncbi:MAG: hypothetical protein A2293_04530 [Elusimicrobia bacterium RIFOXYB2_FULL_49_7]|nr:MAG: hypothetical protein A2293_04530 [Elusimicrobia bacterium RIFOXYB2_FULL_49_7]
MKIRQFVKLAFPVILAVMILQGCSKDSSNPTGPTTETPSITIRTTYKQFLGTPITLYATFSPAVRESDIAWMQKGQILYRASQTNGTRRITADTLIINYNNLPAFSDEYNKDTLFIRMLSNTDLISNRLIIPLMNHRPVLDSALMNNIRVFKAGQTVVRLHLNTQIQGRLRTYVRDIDGQTVKCRVLGLTGYDTLLSDTIWRFNGYSSDTTFEATLEAYDGQGGTLQLPMEIIVYSEAHCIWIASSNQNNVSYLSKLTGDGQYLFSADRFKQIKQLAIYPTSERSMESVWIVDWNSTSVSKDTVFILDDDGRVRYAIGGFKDRINHLSLNLNDNIAYMTEGDTTLRRIDGSSRLSTLMRLPSGYTAEVLAAHPSNIDEYWLSVYKSSDAKRKVIHYNGSSATDTLNYDSLSAIASLSLSPRNNIYWIGEDAKVVVCRLNTDTVISVITGFHQPYVVSDQRSGQPYCWISDRGTSKLYRLSLSNSTTTLSARTTVSAAETANLCESVSLGDGLVFQEAMALDYTQSTQPRLLVADFNQNRILQLNGLTGALLDEFYMADLELENPEAISVNVIVY